VKLINQAFNEQKYPGHADILQIRYLPQSPFAIKLRAIFKSSLNYLQRARTNSKKVIRVPEEKREYIVLYTLCPNHHRVIHKANPTFKREIFSFVYPNGLKEKLALNKHL
jgi:hypothetical protein